MPRRVQMLVIWCAQPTTNNLPLTSSITLSSGKKKTLVPTSVLSIIYHFQEEVEKEGKKRGKKPVHRSLVYCNAHYYLSSVNTWNVNANRMWTNTKFTRAYFTVSSESWRFESMFNFVSANDKMCEEFVLILLPFSFPSNWDSRTKT